MILVTGATGFVGRHLVSRLAQAGWSVRILARPGRGGTFRLPWPDLNLDITPGGIDDPAALALAMRGVHTVFHLVNAQWWGNARALERVEIAGTQAVIDAAREAHVGRLVVMSHLGAAPSSAYTLLRVKGRMEDLVRASGLPYTIIRSGVLFGREDRFVNSIAMLLRTNPAVYLQPGQGEMLLHPLYIDDLAAALVQSLENLDTVDRIIEIGGPEYMSFNEMVRTVMRVTGAPRMIIPVPPYALRSLTRVVGRVLPRWPTTLQWFDILASHRTAGLNTMPDIFGIRPVRFEDTIVRYMRHRRYLVELLRFVARRRHPRGL